MHPFTGITDVLRIYKNAAGDVLRVDTVARTGYLIRSNTYRYKRTVTNNQVQWGDWIFHPSGNLRVDSELYHTGGARVVAEIEMIGGFGDYDDANFDWFDWQAAGSTHREDLSALPNVGDTV